MGRGFGACNMGPWTVERKRKEEERERFQMIPWTFYDVDRATYF